MATLSEFEALEQFLQKQEVENASRPSLTPMQHEFYLLHLASQSRRQTNGLRRDLCTDDMTRHYHAMDAHVQSLRGLYDQLQAAPGPELDAFNLEYVSSAELRHRLPVLKQEVSALPESIVLARGAGRALREAEGLHDAMRDASTYLARESLPKVGEGDHLHAYVADWWSRAVLGRRMTRRVYIAQGDKTLMRTVFDPVHPLSYQRADELSQKLADAFEDSQEPECEYPPLYHYNADLEPRSPLLENPLAQLAWSIPSRHTQLLNATFLERQLHPTSNAPW